MSHPIPSSDVSGFGLVGPPAGGEQLCTDLYQFTMAAGYHASGMTQAATFDLFVRALPQDRGYLIAAGLEQALEYLEQLRFTAEDIAYLKQLPVLQRVPRRFFEEVLPRFRFTGDVWAVEEGTPVFPLEPLMRITAPLPEAQIVETALLATLGFQTSVASRAARLVTAAAGRPVMEFGSRRAHGIDAGLYAARAAFVGGCNSTSNVEAGRRFGIPVSGTMAHSWVMAFESERSAFAAFADLFGHDAVLLLDTYDTLRAARQLIASGLRPRAVRIDSGDLAIVGREVRAVLDEGGLRDTAIVATGELDEWEIDRLVAAGAPVDAFGVGTALSVVSDAPSLGAVYKLVEITRGDRRHPVMKLSPGKHSYPGRKQVWRLFDNLTAVADRLELDDSVAPAGARALLRPVMLGGRRCLPPVSLAEMRLHCRGMCDELPTSLRRLRDIESYQVHVGPDLRRLADELQARSS